MKTKENVTSYVVEKPLKTTEVAKPKKSLRPMRSMMAVRSLKPRTAVAAFSNKVEEVAGLR